ncbi:MAG: hypothetical protein R8M46_00410 [Ghiorsea sp.]
MSPVLILLCVAGVTALLLSICMMSKLRAHTPQALIREAKKSKWVITSQMDVDGYKNVYLSRDEVRASISYKNINIELVQPFSSAPFTSFAAVETWLQKNKSTAQQSQHDPIWETITDSLATEIQAGFMKIYAAVDLGQYTSSKDIPTPIRINFSEAANEIAQKNGINPALVLLVIHQYIDSDADLRKEHTSSWVTFMMSRPTIAPQPETYASYINTTYFNGQLA